MSRTVVTFDDVDLTSMCVVSGWTTALLPVDVHTQAVPGRNGSIYTGQSMGQREIKVTLALLGDTPAERSDMARSIAQALTVDEPRPLCCSIENGLWHYAVPTSTADLKRNVGSNVYDVTFVAPDPIAYGEERSVEVPSGGTVTFEVGGTYPTMPTITAVGAAVGSIRWRLLHGSEYMDVSPYGNLTVHIDCENRSLMVGTNAQMLPRTSDWFVFEPGENTVQMADGTAESCTITWRERWL